MVKIGIIGGSGFDDPNLVSDYREVELDTKYGKPSSKITTGKINGIEVCILARHGKKHEIPPAQVNFRANIAALKMLECTHIIATSAVGSLKEEIHPGDLVFPDQFIDFTKQRKSTFHDEIGEGKVVHTPMAEPFSHSLRTLLMKTCDELCFKNHKKGTVIVIDGPRFSTKGESFFFKQIADIINMSTFPECVLAKESGIEYAVVCMSTDYDCWKDDEEPVTFEIVMQRMRENAEKVKKLILSVLEKLSKNELENENIIYIKNKIRTVPNFPKPGIMFRDITTLLGDAAGFKKTLDVLEKRYKDKDIDLIAGIESRGFVIASALASRLGKGVVLIRKPGKLPGETVKESYNLEYGSDAVEIHRDAIRPGQKVLLVDDLIATGGTACAAGNLIEKIGGKITECSFIIDLPDLKGKEKLRWPVFCLVEFAGE